jgi:hypothetical protein
MRGSLMGLARSYPIAVAKMCGAVHTGSWSASAAQGHVRESGASASGLSPALGPFAS